MNAKVYLKDLFQVIVICCFAACSIVSYFFDIPAISGMSIIIGVTFFFRNKKINNLNRFKVGLTKLGLWHHIKRNWLLIIVPSLLNFLVIGLSKLVLPEYLVHVIDRVEGMLTLDKLPILVVQFIVFVFLEELAWRGVVQHNIAKYTKPLTAIIVSSTFFALAHLAKGPINIIMFDLFFILLNSIVYGLIFSKTKNLYASTLSHFIANLSGMIFFMLII